MKTVFQISDELINNIQEFNDSEFDMKNSIEEAKFILLNEMNTNHLSNCDFDDNIWYLFSGLQGDRRIINFNELIKHVQFNPSLNTNEFIDVLKCWTASLLPAYTVASVHNYLRGIKTFFTLTKGLTLLSFDDITDDFKEMNVTLKKDTCLSALNFFDYYSDFETHDDIISLIYQLKKQYKIKGKARIIPPSKDILVFSKIIEKYFSSPLKDEDYFKWFPIWLWWVFTNIIPMRPSEFCDIDRDCLSISEGKYYIKLPRKKQKKAKGKIQVIDKINIPKDLYQKIEDYKNRTNQFGKTKTLISFPSISQDEKVINRKLIPTKFSSAIFRGLLSSFYEKIVFVKFEINLVNEDDIDALDWNCITQKVRPGDTRHLAFINLKRQGYHPVEIARVGGHTSLQSQYHYFNHITNYVDLEILQLVTQIDLNSYYNKIKKESNNEYSLGTSFVEKYVLRPANTPTKIKMEDGYCTDPEQRCKTEDCWECDSWRISLEEFKEKKQIFEKKMKDSQSYINEVIDNLKNLYQTIYANIGYDEFYSSENPELRKQLINQSKRIDKAITKYINLNKVKERIDSIGIGNKR